MTDDERMDRAKRIREMREGARSDDDDESSSDENTTAEESSSDEIPTDEETVSDETTTAEAATNGDQSEDQHVSDEVTQAGTPDGGTPASDGADDGDQTNSAESSDGDDQADSEDSSGDGPEKQTMEELVQQAAESAADNIEAEDIADELAEAQADPDDISAPLPDMDELEEALEGTETASDPETVSPEVAGGGPDAPAEAVPAGGDATAQPAVEQEQAPEGTTTAAETETSEEETRVLEFTLDDEHYCLDIQYIEEIVKEETITRVPNTPEHVQGVVDLRGQITTILNPKVTIGKENDEAGELIVVFDSQAFEDQGYIGWVVDDVRQVSPIIESEVNDPPMSEEYINGVIDRDDDDQFVIWTSPDLAFEDDD